VDALRKAAREIRRSSVGYEDEVLGYRIDGAPLSKHIDDFLRGVIVRGQETYERVEKAIARVEAQDASGGSPVDRAVLRSLIYRHILEESPWGDDDKASAMFWARSLLEHRFFF
jgi:hypothetical protein